MRPDAAQSSRIQLRDDLEWPCFIVESSDGFTFCTAEEATTLIAGHSRSGLLDDEDRRLTVYHIVGPFVPNVPGRDEVGRLTHTHLGATEAAGVAANGIGFSWRMFH